MSVQNNLIHIQSFLPPHVTLVAVSKTKPVSDLYTAYNSGQRVFGENKIQEMTDKWIVLPKDIQWHMIGHVQTNKIKLMAEYVSLIHGVDSLNLLIEIDKEAKKKNRVIACLLQVYIATEETKFGLNETELYELLNSETFLSLTNIRIEGLMGMASYTTDKLQIEREFRYLKSIYDKLKIKHPDFKNLSMGMSGDFELAISCGSTMVRIGSRIFGDRK